MWIKDLIFGHSIAHAVLVLSAVIALGVGIGHFRLFGISLGIAGVLFSGLAFGHFGMVVEPAIIEFAREFGLILFVYTIGMQVGPSFFASFRKQGLRLNVLAAGVVFLGVLVSLGLYLFAHLPIAVVVGLLSGAVTNTPGLGAAQQALRERLPDMVNTGELSGMAYAVAYPFGIIGIILSMIAMRLVFRISPQREAEKYEEEQTPASEVAENFNMVVTNNRVSGLDVRGLSGMVQAEFVISRLMHGDQVVVPTAETKLQIGDILHVVCSKKNAEKLAVLVGEISNIDVRKVESSLTSRSILITRHEAVGKQIRELDLMNTYGVAITRINRAGITLVARAGTVLWFGDRVTVVGSEPSINKVAAELGDSMKQLNHPNILPVFIGIILGVLLGSIPFAIPGVPAPVKLGLAGGPLLVAILLSRFARVGPVVWYLPQSANLMLREVGITLFLAAVGLKSGGRFVETLIYGDGFYWMCLAALITVVPLLIIGVIARAVFKINYMSLCGLLSGSMTDPPALSFANQIASSDAPSVTYASVYALVMFLRILTAQAIVLLLA
ncbi:MAG TPA: putative transporter [Fibrobacteria bacterium]|nr:putative transporter [Fibrobacteria bacterium]